MGSKEESEGPKIIRDLKLGGGYQEIEEPYSNQRSKETEDSAKM